MTAPAAEVADASISSPKPDPDHFRRAPTDHFRRAPTDIPFSFADRALIERLWTGTP